MHDSPATGDVPAGTEQGTGAGAVQNVAPPTAEPGSGRSRRSWRRLLLSIYVLLLVASNAVRLSRPTQIPSGRDLSTLQEVRGSQRGDEAVRLGVLHWPVAASAAASDTTERTQSELEQGISTQQVGVDAVPVVLIHGSPGSAGNFGRLAPLLATDRDVWAIDLPGFGASSRSVADYSIEAHADYVLQFLQQQQIETAHLVGFSMGGGVVLHLAERQPQRVRSLTLLAAIGVQELELLGNYHLNHLVHGAQLWGLRACQWLLPQFGVLDDGMLSIEYARNFYDTDQRPLRGFLRRWAGPMLILHGEQDPLVPRQAAIEHARIVPQAELVMRKDSHFFVFADPEGTAATLQEFLSRVERGTAAERSQASEERLAAAALPFDPAVIPPWTGPSLLVVFLLIALATFISEDLTCIGAGVLVAQGRLDLTFAIVACWFGIVVGDLLLFALGRSLGRRAVRRAPLRWWISEQALEESSRWLRRRGAIVVLLSRFLPGARLPTNVAAGVLRTHAIKFLFYFALAGALWTPPVVWASAKVGEQLLPQLDGLRGKLVVAALLLAVFMWVVRKVGLPLLTHRGRRRLYGRIERLRHWEFWPWGLVYPPVVLACTWFGLRRGSLLLCTAANPSMPGGGIAGESKSDILGRVKADVVPAWTLLAEKATPNDVAEREQQAAERVAEALAFLDERKLGYPVVLKPDAGERGDYVEVVHDDDELRTYFERRSHHPTLLQQYVGGVEYGVFWSRGPDDRDGRILSINEKRRPTVTGDGRRSLEELILDDPRAVALLAKYRREHPEAGTQIPAVDETVDLVEVGAHKRGTIFLDARELETPALFQAIEQIADSFESFDFGRLDIKAPSVEAFQRGEQLSVLEINGITSEVAHIYDRRYSLFAAWRDLIAQWRECYRIGAQRRTHGQQPIGWRDLFRIVRERPTPE